MFDKVVNIQNDSVSNPLSDFQIKGMDFLLLAISSIQITPNFYCLCYSPFSRLKLRGMALIRYYIIVFYLM